MKAITTPKAWLAAMLLVLCAGTFTACSNDDNHTSADATQLMGLYDVTITPSIGQQKMAQGSHTLYAELTVEGRHRLRIHWEKFNAPMFGKDGQLSTTQRMPFDMTVDLVLELRKNKDGEVTMQSVSGRFKAEPHAGTPVDPSKLPGGIAIPNPKGFETDRATATGRYKDGRLWLSVSPQILPITIIVEGTKKRN